LVSCIVCPRLAIVLEAGGRTEFTLSFVSGKLCRAIIVASLLRDLFIDIAPVRLSIPRIHFCLQEETPAVGLLNNTGASRLWSIWSLAWIESAIGRWDLDPCRADLGNFSTQSVEMYIKTCLKRVVADAFR
jgi:hypothetical protein